MKQNKLIAITGGIGSGKTTVCKILREKGYNVISCDNYTEKAYFLGRSKRFLSKNFKSAIKKEPRFTVDKKELSKIIFSDEQKYDKLNSFLIPIIFKMVLKETKKLKGIVFVEVPLLYESGLSNRFDKIVVIKRDLKEREESVKKRSNLTSEQFFLRVSHQFDYDKNECVNAIIIHNDKDEKELERKIEDLLLKI